MSLITLGLCQIKVGAVQTDSSTGEPSGSMPSTMTKIGKTYKDTAKINQDAAEVTEHFEEGKAAPEVRKKSKKMPKIQFSIMDPDPEFLATYIGGSHDTTTHTWSFDGDEVVANKAITVESEQGLDFDVPNGDIEATINADMSAKGIFLVDFVVTPMPVASGKAIRGKKKSTTSSGGGSTV